MCRGRRTHDHEIIKNRDFDREVFCRLETELFHVKLVAALQNPEGATIFQLMCSTGWQCHTIRGAISGVLRKKYGLKIELAASANGERVYRIV